MPDYSPPTRTGFLGLPVLQFLWGQPWDQLAQNFVHSLRPSHVRVSDGDVKCDSQSWRVTVYVREGMIVSMEQEVEVGLDGGFEHGHGLYCEALKRGIVLR